MLIIFIQSSVGADVTNVAYPSYTYNFWGQMVPAPQAYVPVKVFNGRDLGVGDLNGPQDLFVQDNGNVYIVDTINNRILGFDQNWNLLRIIKEFENNGQIDHFNKPTGVYVRANGWMYIADHENERVIVLDENARLIIEITSPATDTEGFFTEDFRFKPQKIGVDHYGRIYVICAGVYDGILEFSIDGEFRGFIGAPKVTPSIADYIWRKIGTKAQKERMLLFLPVEHSNMDIDERGFIYATVIGGAVKDDEKIRRLNISGDNVLRQKDFLPPIGDYVTGSAPKSTFVDIKSREFGIYSVLDRTRGRIFTYDINGNLLYVFGGLGEQVGTFRTPVAIDALDEDLIILDAEKNQLTIFTPTEYKKMIHAAIGLYNRGKYDEAAEMWKGVLKQNSNFDMAYSGIGNALFLKGEYEAAMSNFKLGNNRPDYSKAYKLYRKESIEKNFGWIMLGIVLLVIAIVYITVKTPEKSVADQKAKIAEITTEMKYWEEMNKRGFVISIKRTLRGLQYAFHLIFHPFDGFWDLKHEKRGNLPAASVLLTLVVFTYLLIRQYTGFIFNERNLKELNIVLEIVSVLFPFLLWSAINWSLTTLMDGKGSFKDIVIASAYALTPIILINIPLTLISNYLVLEEGAFYYFFFTVSIIWSLSLLFFGTMVTHDYDMPKTILVTILIIAGIVVSLFIGLVFIDMFNQFLGFLVDIYTELAFRI